MSQLTVVGICVWPLKFRFHIYGKHKRRMQDNLSISLNEMEVMHVVASHGVQRVVSTIQLSQAGVCHMMS